MTDAPKAQTFSLDRRRLQPMSIAEALELPPRLPLVKGMLGQGELSCLVGPPGCGKSFLAQHLGLSVARELPFFGRRTAGGAAIYIAGEGIGGMARRLAAYLDHHAVLPQAIPFLLLPSAVNLGAEQNDVIELASEIEAACDGLRQSARLIVVDTLARSMGGGSENDPQDMGRFVAACDALRDRTKAHVAIVHHVGKDASRGGRGHSSLLGAIDAELTVEKTEAGNRFTLSKSKDDAGGWSVGFDLKVVELGRDGDGDPITSCVVVETERDASPASSAVKLSPACSIALAALREAVAEGGRPPSPSSHAPASVRAVPAELWRQFAYGRQISDGEQNARRMAFKRASEQLIARGLVGAWQGEVWPVEVMR